MSTPQQLTALLDTISQKFTVGFEPLHVDETPLEVLSILNMNQHIDGLLAQKSIQNPLKDLPLWAKIWPAAFVLGRFLRKFSPEGKSLLELGAGCGITGCIASRYGFSSVCISDVVSDALLFAKANVLKNALEDTVTVRHVDITNSKASLKEQRFDMIVASEILYLEELHRPLIKCIKRHLAKNGTAILCTDIARKKPRFFKQAAKEFTITEQMVGVKSMDMVAGEEKEQRRIYALHILEAK